MKHTEILVYVGFSQWFSQRTCNYSDAINFRNTLYTSMKHSVYKYDYINLKETTESLHMLHAVQWQCDSQRNTNMSNSQA